MRSSEYDVTIVPPAEEMAWWGEAALARWDGDERVTNSSGVDFEATDSLAELLDQVRDELAFTRRTYRITAVRYLDEKGHEWDRDELQRLAGMELPA